MGFSGNAIAQTFCICYPLFHCSRQAIVADSLFHSCRQTAVPLVQIVLFSCCRKRPIGLEVRLSVSLQEGRRRDTIVPLLQKTTCSTVADRQLVPLLQTDSLLHFYKQTFYSTVAAKLDVPLLQADILFYFCKQTTYSIV